jgi:hypothetical protein
MMKRFQLRTFSSRYKRWKWHSSFLRQKMMFVEEHLTTTCTSLLTYNCKWAKQIADRWYIIFIIENMIWNWTSETHSSQVFQLLGQYESSQPCTQGKQSTYMVLMDRLWGKPLLHRQSKGHQRPDNKYMHTSPANVTKLREISKN